MTYFRTRACTIIGAFLFHGPVRDGKGWVQSAMAAKHNWFVRRGLWRRTQNGKKDILGCDCITRILSCLRL